MNRKLIAVGILVASAAMVIVPARFFGNTVLIDRIIARVNEEIVTQRQYNQQVADLRASLAQHFSGDELQEQYDAQSKNLLRDMIDEDLLVQKAKDLGINVETELVERLDQIRKQFGLASIQDLEDYVEKQGLVWEDFQENQRRQLLLRHVEQQEVAPRIMPTDAQLRKYFAAHLQDYQSPAGVDLAEILVSNQKWGAAQAEQRGKQALSMLESGAKWDDVVKKYSDGPNADSGGETGFAPAGELIPEITQAIKGLDPGDTSKLIATQSGYTIFRLNARRSAGGPKFEEVRARVEDDYYQTHMQAALRAYLTTLRRESCISILPGFADSGALHPGAVGSAQDGCL
ncbi:MAG: peptidylprolyl isomerase [Terriglobia bacterium]